MLAGVAVAVGGAAGLRLGWRALQENAYFVVERVDIAGAVRVPPDEIRILAAVSPGDNLWDLDLAAIRARVLRHPWVADARVRRTPPDALVIAIEERRLVGALSMDGVRIGIDARGDAFAALDLERAKAVPAITGIVPDSKGRSLAVTRRRLRNVARLLRLLDGHGLGNGQGTIGQVSVDGDAGVTVQMGANGQLPVHWGWGQWRHKRRRLDAVLELWASRTGDLVAVNVADGDRVVVRVRRGAGPAPLPVGVTGLSAAERSDTST